MPKSKPKGAHRGIELPGGSQPVKEEAAGGRVHDGRVNVVKHDITGTRPTATVADDTEQDAGGMRGRSSAFAEAVGRPAEPSGRRSSNKPARQTQPLRQSVRCPGGARLVRQRPLERRLRKPAGVGNVRAEAMPTKEKLGVDGVTTPGNGVERLADVRNATEAFSRRYGKDDLGTCNHKVTSPAADTRLAASKKQEGRDHSQTGTQVKQSCRAAGLGKRAKLQLQLQQRCVLQNAQGHLGRQSYPARPRTGVDFSECQALARLGNEKPLGDTREAVVFQIAVDGGEVGLQGSGPDRTLLSKPCNVPSNDCLGG